MVIRPDSPLAASPGIARELAVGVLLECPLGGNPADCVLHELRKWTVEERLDWLDGLSDDSCAELYDLHLQCLQHKSRSGAPARAGGS